MAIERFRFESEYFLFFFFKNIIERNYTMPKLLQELEVLCNADKRKSTDELPFISAHMLHDLYLRWNLNHETKQLRA